MNKRILLGLGLGLFACEVFAGFAPDAQELQTLPPYCTPRINETDPAGWAQGAAQFGEGWNHMHHYCYALNFINRYYRSRDAATKRDALKQAIGNIDYMLDHTGKGYFMRGQWMLDKGKVMMLAGNKPQGIAMIQAALDLNPGLEAGYRLISDTFVELGNKKEALEWVSTGLQHVPGSKALQRRYKDLGGKEPYPEPLIKPVPPAEEAKPTIADESAPKVEEKKVEEKPEAIPETPPVDSPKIGSPTNPYCRFCTE